MTCEEPRPGAPRKISDEQVEAVVVATLERSTSSASLSGRCSWVRSECSARERALHARFEVYRREGEWLEFPDDVDPWRPSESLLQGC